eukprot:jgi/Ulvmu1/11772/UM008_0186.1
MASPRVKHIRVAGTHSAAASWKLKHKCDSTYLPQPGTPSTVLATPDPGAEEDVSVTPPLLCTTPVALLLSPLPRPTVNAQRPSANLSVFMRHCSVPTGTPQCSMGDLAAAAAFLLTARDACTHRMQTVHDSRRSMQTAVKTLESGLAEKQERLNVAKANLIRISAYNRELHQRTTSAMANLLDLARRSDTVVLWSGLPPTLTPSPVPPTTPTAPTGCLDAQFDAACAVLSPPFLHEHVLQPQAPPATHSPPPPVDPACGRSNAAHAPVACWRPSTLAQPQLPTRIPIPRVAAVQQQPMHVNAAAAPASMRGIPSQQSISSAGQQHGMHVCATAPGAAIGPTSPGRCAVEGLRDSTSLQSISTVQCQPPTARTLTTPLAAVAEGCFVVSAATSHTYHDTTFGGCLSRLIDNMRPAAPAAGAGMLRTHCRGSMREPHSAARTKNGPPHGGPVSAAAMTPFKQPGVIERKMATGAADMLPIGPPLLAAEARGGATSLGAAALAGVTGTHLVQDGRAPRMPSAAVVAAQPALGRCAAGLCSVCFRVATPPPSRPGGAAGGGGRARIRAPRGAGAAGPGAAAANAAVVQMATAMHAQRQQAAATVGVPPACAQWVVHTPFPLPGPGELWLAFSTRGEDASCRCSMHAFVLASRLEFCFGTAAMDARAGHVAPTAQDIKETLRPLLFAMCDDSMAAATMMASDGSRVPLLAGVTHLVAAMCRLHSARLRRAQWMRACGRFADMHAMHASCQIQGSACGGECMCCGVRACVLAAMWECVEARMNSEPVAMAAPEPEGMHAHFHSILSALSIMQSHCPLQELLAMLQPCCMRDEAAESIGGTMCGLHFYSQLRQPQRARLAGAWHAWQSGRRELDMQQHDALQPLLRLPGLADLQRCIRRIAVPATVQLRRLSGAVAPLQTGAWPAPRRGGGLPTASGVAAAAAGGQHEEVQLLGASVEAQSAAESALRRLTAVQHRAGASLRDWVRAGSTPGVFFSVEQLLLREHLSCAHRVARGDWLLVCRMSALDAKHAQTFQSVDHMLDL